MRSLLKDRNARWYLGGQSFSLFGDVALWLAMGIWVKELTGSSGEAGLVFFFFGLAAVLSPVAGLVVDRVARRPLLIVANLAGCGTVLLLLAVHGRSQVWLIFAVAFGYGWVYTFLSAGQSALLVEMLPDALLPDANGLLRTVREALRLVGPLVGAGLFAVAGGGVVAVVDSATFAIAAGSLLFVRVDGRRAPPGEEHFFAEVTAGIRHLWRTTVLRQMVVAISITMLVVGFFESIAFSVVTVGLHRAPTFLGVVLAAQGAGALVGGPSAAPLVRRWKEGPLIGVGLVVLAAGTGLTAEPTLETVLGGAVLLGLSLPWIIVGAVTLLQRRTPANLQGRVSSAADTLLSVPQTISIGVGAGLVSVVDYRLLLGAVAVVVIAAALYLLTRKEQWLEWSPEPGASEPGGDGEAAVLDPAERIGRVGAPEH